MRITINGEAEDVEAELTVTELLARRRIDAIRVAVEVNEDVIPRKTFSDTTIRDGDRIEIVTFVGGG